MRGRAQHDATRDLPRRQQLGEHGAEIVADVPLDGGTDQQVAGQHRQPSHRRQLLALAERDEHDVIARRHRMQAVANMWQQAVVGAGDVIHAYPQIDAAHQRMRRIAE